MDEEIHIYKPSRWQQIKEVVSKNARAFRKSFARNRKSASSPTAQESVAIKPKAGKIKKQPKPQKTPKDQAIKESQAAKIKIKKSPLMLAKPTTEALATTLLVLAILFVIILGIILPSK